MVNDCLVTPKTDKTKDNGNLICPLLDSIGWSDNVDGPFDRIYAHSLPQGPARAMALEDRER